jgi:phosphate starvation-inducible PhoH-like protein
LEVTIKVPSGEGRVGVLGPSERNLKMLREALGVQVMAREGRVFVSGPKPGVLVARSVLNTLLDAAETEPLGRQAVLDLIAAEAASIGRQRAGWSIDGAPKDGTLTDEEFDEDPTWQGRLNVYSGGVPIRARTDNQASYLEAIIKNDLVFGIGPAGTGKTYLAVAAAVHLLRQERVRRVLLARPAVEAGEKLGYLPGDLRAKVNPYLRPLFDALSDMMDYNTVRRFMENDVVEVVPLAFMRGRTLNNAVIILDEAQNTTRGQMKMFLTRMGEGSKVVVTGDPSQVDLPEPDESGLIDATNRLAKTEGVAFIHFNRSDVVRHQMVQRVIDAYGDDDLSTLATGTRGGRRRPRPEADGYGRAMRP